MTTRNALRIAYHMIERSRLALAAARRAGGRAARQARPRLAGDAAMGGRDDGVTGQVGGRRPGRRGSGRRRRGRPLGQLLDGQATLGVVLAQLLDDSSRSASERAGTPAAGLPFPVHGQLLATGGLPPGGYPGAGPE